MANKIIEEIVKKLEPGGTSYYADRNNEYDSNTITATTKEFEKFIKDKKNWGELVRAIYSTRSEFKGGEWAIAPLKGTADTWTIINTKKPKIPAFDVKVSIKQNTLVINNLKQQSKNTFIELGEMIEAQQETMTSDKFVETVITNLEKSKSKFKSPKDVTNYLQTLISDYK
jgi:hypothetical protein